jgi:hypothetical protein
MLEVIKHLFGFCGEGHPNLLLGFGFAQIILLKNHIKLWFKYLILYLKNFLLLFWQWVLRN